MGIEKKKLKRIGYWHSKEEPNLPTPIENSDKLDPPTRTKIVNYLNSGKTIDRYRGWSNCRICKMKNGSTDISDGEYVWPSGLSHYVEQHHVKLPDEFVHKILTRIAVLEGLADIKAGRVVSHEEVKRMLED